MEHASSAVPGQLEGRREGDHDLDQQAEEEEEEALLHEESGDLPTGVPEARAEVVASKTLLGEICYVVRLASNRTGRQKHVLRRYDDFLALDEGLRAALGDGAASEASAAVAVLPDLPSRGRFGLRSSLSSLGLGGFNENLKDGLQAYLDGVLMQAGSLEDVPPLREFCDVALTSRTRKLWGDPLAARHEGGSSAGSTDSNTVTLAMACQLLAALRTMDQEMAALDVERTAQEAAEQVFQRGTRVIIVGLVEQTRFNSWVVSVVEYNAASRQYRVALDGSQLVSAQGDNFNLQGRIVRAQDVNLRLAPVVIGSKAWDDAWAAALVEDDLEKAYKESALKGWARMSLRMSTHVS